VPSVGEFVEGVHNLSGPAKEHESGRSVGETKGKHHPLIKTEFDIQGSIQSIPNDEELFDSILAFINLRDMLHQDPPINHTFE